LGQYGVLNVLKALTIAQASSESKGYVSSFFRRFGKKISIVVGIIAIAVVVLALLIPSGAATIPLNVSYIVGEKMVYQTIENIAASATANPLQNSNLNTIKEATLTTTETQEVLDFDGYVYTLNHTLTTRTPTAFPSTIAISFEEQIQKTGYSDIIFHSQNPDQDNVSIVKPIWILTLPEVKVGDTKVVPIAPNNSSGFTGGTMTLTFVDIENRTVPAGVFTVFRVDSSSNNIRHILNGRAPPNMSLSFVESFTKQSYVEFNTGRLIESITYANAYEELTDLTQTTDPRLIMQENITCNTQLIEDILPEQTVTPTPTPNPSVPKPDPSSFLQNVANLDLGHYTIQSNGQTTDGFFNYSLASPDSTLDTIVGFSNGQVSLCKLYPSSGTPVFSSSATSNLESTKAILKGYASYSQVQYVQPMCNMLDNITDNGLATLTDGTLTLTVSINDNETSFVWSSTQPNSQTANSTFAVTVQNGVFESLCDSWT